MKRILCSFLISLSFFDLFGQNLLSQQSKLLISAEVSYQRMDAFFNISVQKRIHYFEIGAALGTGIEKTFFQQRFSPHLELYSYFNLIQREIGRKNGFVFGPGILLDYTSYRIQNTINYKDAFLGYNLSVGRKFKFTNQAGIGYMLESFQSAENKIKNSTLNYFVKIGMVYAIN